RGHTNGDAWIVFPSLRVVHAGDIFSGKNLPLLDYNNGGSGIEIGGTPAQAPAGIKNADTNITGHRTTMKWNDLKEYSQFNKDFLSAVRGAQKAGRSADEVAASWKLPDKYTSKGYVLTSNPAQAQQRLKDNVTNLYKEIK